MRSSYVYGGKESRYVQTSRPARRGNVMIYTVLALSALCAVGSLAVDLGRAEMVKGELQRSADAAARGSAPQLPTAAYVQYAAIGLASLNYADNYPVTLLNSDIVMGSYNASTLKFTANGSPTNAVQIIAQRTKARSSAVPLTLMRLFGRTSIDIYATSTATYSAAVNDTNHQITAKSNPWLAGMPAGTIANNPNPHSHPDFANGTTSYLGSSTINGASVGTLTASPQQITALPIVPGQLLQFNSINGSANNDPSGGVYTPDGNTGQIVSNQNGNENGISNMTCPIIALVGIFLDNSQPDSTAAPTFTSDDLNNCPTDYTTQAARDKTSYAPKLKQPFFIGDGLTSAGAQQSWVVPTGATRLYVGTMDIYEWNNNVGYYSTTIIRPQQITLVKAQ